MTKDKHIISELNAFFHENDCNKAINFVKVASHKEITRNARTLRLPQTELQVQSMN